MTTRPTEQNDLKLRAEAVEMSKALLATSGKILRDESITEAMIWNTIRQFEQLRKVAEKAEKAANLHEDNEAAWYRLTLRYLHQELHRRIKLQSVWVQ